ncbi:M1 family metallopeptidase [Asticcacaulis machinosus]|uniref:Aminopeptidase N n=1 Tax=Asticcacaulis machinosus TaxID=2984211 RepID=A0ABT5HL76_9CAUL|nr:M1 family metallopeptidase [Asticcacaulis machinosus]MDC7677001.1 M1 family metallopeptidase [Asticcacaulis machinosus]
MAFAVLFTVSACSPKPDEGSAAPLAIAAKAVDHHSYAKPLEARVRHVDLDLTADFDRKILSGTAALSLETEPDARQVILDTKALNILGVTDAAGAPLKYALGKSDPILGAPLTIELPQGAQKVIVRYETTNKTEALQWLSPSQTAGKQHPFLFSQGQAILTRSWLPTQDSPAIRQTYSARIVTPRALKAVMSADMLTPDGEDVIDAPGKKAYRFKMDEAIPPYLIAIAVGEIDFRPLGKRTGVYAEKVTVEAAADEFVDVEKMVGAAEKLYGPYRWGRYDILVLPPSFPYGGMENPRLTFATPTILAGDRSLVSLVAHELAHSWSGNLVTNATWNDFWLNEGFTVYFENRIMEELYGKDRAAMLRTLGYQDLQDTVKGYMDDKHPELTALYIDLKGKHPDDGFSEIPYEKGASFLRVIEDTVGRRRFDAYLKGYFNRYAFKSMTTDAFIEDLSENLLKGDKALEDKINVRAWIYDPGLPTNIIVPKSDAFDKVDAQVAAFIGGAAPAELQTTDWTTQEWQRFLNQMPETLTVDQMVSLDDRFKFSASHNSEILFLWLKLAIAHHYEPAMPALETFLTSQGRRKFITPLYRDLMERPGWGQAMARRVYAEARSGYHEVTRASVDKVVN